MENITESSEAAVQNIETPISSTPVINEEKIPDSSENSQKPKPSKAKKRKKPKDSTAPRVPLTGNVQLI